MTRCRHGVDFAEYTSCSECDRDDINQLENERDYLRELLAQALPLVPLSERELIRLNAKIRAALELDREILSLSGSDGSRGSLLFTKSGLCASWQPAGQLLSGSIESQQKLREELRAMHFGTTPELQDVAEQLDRFARTGKAPQGCCLELSSHENARLVFCCDFIADIDSGQKGQKVFRVSISEKREPERCYGSFDLNVDQTAAFLKLVEQAVEQGDSAMETRPIRFGLN